MAENALIRFSNNDVLQICENSLLVPIQKVSHNGKNFTSELPPVAVESHIQFGLIPSITDIVSYSEFFRVVDNPNKIYKSSAIVTIENL